MMRNSWLQSLTGKASCLPFSELISQEEPRIVPLLELFPSVGNYGSTMDTMTYGHYIQELRKALGMNSQSLCEEMRKEIYVLMNYFMAGLFCTLLSSHDIFITTLRGMILFLVD